MEKRKIILKKTYKLEVIIYNKVDTANGEKKIGEMIQHIEGFNIYELIGILEEKVQILKEDAKQNKKVISK